MPEQFNLNIYSVGREVSYYRRNAYHVITVWNEGYTDECRVGVITHISPEDVEIECVGDSYGRKIYLQDFIKLNLLRWRAHGERYAIKTGYRKFIISTVIYNYNL